MKNDDTVKKVHYTNTCAQDTFLMLVTILTAFGRVPPKLISDDKSVLVECANLIMTDRPTDARLLLFSLLGKEGFPKSSKISESGSQRRINCQTSVNSLMGQLPDIKLPYYQRHRSQCSENCGVTADNFANDRSSLKISARHFMNLEESVSQYFNESHESCEGVVATK